MKSILSASICTAALAFALPAMAQDTKPAKPMHHMHHHHMSKMDHMQGPKTHNKRAGDPTTDDLNAKSLEAARGGSAPAGAMAPASGAMAPSSGAMAPSSGAMAPSSGTMAPPSGSMAPASGATTTPGNAPQGQ